MLQQRSTHNRLKRLPRLFRKADAEKIAPHAAQFLSRATTNGLIQRINRGNYINVFLYGYPRIEEIACFIRPPAYVSCEWALHYHGISLQVPFVCTTITLSGAVGRQRAIDYQDVTIEFSRVADKLFFGFVSIDHFQIATAEKALLDTLYLHKTLPAADELEWDDIDSATLFEMAAQYPAIVAKRLRKIIDNAIVTDFSGRA